MWLYRTSTDTKRQIVLFEYQPSRSSTHPKQLLKDFKGFLHTDYADKINIPISQ
jgi:hypothetical protein